MNRIYLQKNIDKTLSKWSTDFQSIEQDQNVFSQKLHYFFMLNKANKQLQMAEYYFSKGREYFYFSSLLYKKAISILGYFEIRGSEVILAKYKHAKRMMIHPAYLEKYDSWILHEKFIIGSANGKQALFNYEGVRISEFYDKLMGYNHHDFIKVIQHGNMGLLDAQLNEILPCKYESILMDERGIYAVKENDKWMLCDKGDMVVIPKIKDIKPGTSSCFPAKTTKWGFIDRKGDELIPFQFDDVGKFVSELCPVKQNGKWGYIDQNGKIMISQSFDSASNFNKHGIALIQKNKLEYFINSKGIMISHNSPSINKLFKNS